MTTFEYLAVLISIIVGLGITQLLGGVARFISNPGKYKLYWIHLVWTFVVFLNLINFWWVELWMNRVEEWTAPLFGFLVFQAVILFLICAVIIPSDFPEDRDFRRYFYERRRWFFGMCIAVIFMAVWDLWMKGEEPSSALNVLFLALFGTGMVTKNAKFHGAFAISCFLLGLFGLFAGAWDRLLIG